jgi:hypothetical protein
MIYHTTGSLTTILNNAPFTVGTAFLPSGPAKEDGTGYGAPTGGGNLYIFDTPDNPRSEAQLEPLGSGCSSWPRRKSSQIGVCALATSLHASRRGR